MKQVVGVQSTAIVGSSDRERLMRVVNLGLHDDVSVEEDGSAAYSRDHLGTRNQAVSKPAIEVAFVVVHATFFAVSRPDVR